MKTVRELLESYAGSLFVFSIDVERVLFSVFASKGDVFSAIEDLKRTEREPLRRLYLDTAKDVFRHVFYGETPTEQDGIEKTNRIIEIITGMPALDYLRQASKTRYLLDDEVVQFTSFFYNMTIFGAYYDILFTTHQLVSIPTVFVRREPPRVWASMDAVEKVNEIVKLLDEKNELTLITENHRNTKYGQMLRYAYFYEPLKTAYLLQSSLPEPILVIALAEYMKHVFERVYFARDVVEKLLRRYKRLRGDTPFINACEVALGKSKEPKSRTAELLLSRS